MKNKSDQWKAAAQANTRHGFARRNKRDPIYGVWRSMLSRCCNPNSYAYSMYGGRGIRVCERWKDFVVFLSDMGYRPSEQHTIERINNDGDYCPENCRWATKDDQARNKRSNRIITFNGKSLCLSAWAEELHLSPGTLGARIRKGMALEKAMSPQLPVTSASDRQTEIWRKRKEAECAS